MYDAVIGEAAFPDGDGSDPGQPGTIVKNFLRIAAGSAVVDARDIPDLIPVLSVLAAVSPGQTQEAPTVSEVLQEIAGNTGTADSQDAGDTAEAAEEPDGGAQETLPEDGSYTTKEDVSLYLVTYGHLPGNFVTKKEAEKAGWSGGSLEDVLPGKCIGGDRFGNREGLLPKAEGRTWTECDINTLGKKSRGPERLVFSNDGLIYYTADHYESFTKLYG